MPDTHDRADGPHARATAAMLSLRDHGARILAAVTDAQDLAPHHLLALRAVAEGARTIGEVAAAVDRHVSSTSRTVDQLVSEDLVERGEDPDDRRQVVLRLSRRGQQVVERFGDLDRRLVQRILDPLSDEEADHAARVLARIAEEARAVVAELESDPGAVLGED